MRFKKIIIIFSLVTFLFLPFSGSKRVEALPIALAPPILQALGELAVVLGCVALTSDTLLDMGERIVTTVSNAGDDIKNYLVDGGIKLSAKLLNYIASSAKEFPTSDIITYTDVGEIDFPFSISGVSDSYFLSCKFKDVSDVRINLFHNDSNIAHFDIKVPDDGIVNFNVPTSVAVFYYIAAFDSSGNLLGKMATDVNRLTNLRLVSSESASIGTTIPYSPDVTKDYDDDNLITTFPGVMGGTHTGVWELPTDTQYDISTSFPLTQESLKDKVNEIPLDGATDGTVDGTVDGTIDGTVDGTTDGILDNIFDFLKSLIVPESYNSIDFSPLYFSFSDKFPFSIPFDVINLIKEFEAEKKEPVFFIDMSSFSTSHARGEVGFTLDFTTFEDLFEIARFFILISFIFFIVIKTRDIVKG